jgi:hypothetical protein
MGGRIDTGQPVPELPPLTGDGGALYGIAGSLSGRTPVGPFVLSLGYVTDDSWQVQFALGRPISEGSILDEIR